KYINAVEERTLEEGLTAYDAWYLVTTYGKQSDQILAIFDSLKSKDPQERLIRAEVQFCIQYERVSTPMDFFIRRTGRLYFNIEQMREYLSVVLDEFREFAGATDKEVKNWNKKLQQIVKEHSEFSPERA
ncbi:MAG: glycerol-3-phosphate dehydrogenase, partial [Eudoraea sp.]|nr:glycerol-3-phosphate dehydrogenase [Eudoraea sp.]